MIMLKSMQYSHAFLQSSCGKVLSSCSSVSALRGFQHSSISSRGNEYNEGNNRYSSMRSSCNHMTSRSSLSQFQKTSVFPHVVPKERIFMKKSVAHFSSLASYNCSDIKSTTRKQGQLHNFQIVFVRKFTSNCNMSGKGPGLIVFDLDCTLWPLHVDTTVNPPFIKTDSKIVDQDGKLITYYPEVPKVLEYLKSEGYPIGVASRTTKPPGAEQLLNFFDWNKYISYKEIYPGSKVTHFAKFVEKTKLSHSDMLFFDDEQRNIIDMEKEGVKCVFVKDGVDLQLVKDSIEQFKNGNL